jgi:serine/threonine protein kinase
MTEISSTPGKRTSKAHSPAPSQGSVRPFSQLGRYTILAKIGMGGMAEVYLAQAKGHGGFAKLMVLKILRDHLRDNPEVRLMFLNEARLAARFNHRNVVQTYEVGECDGIDFIAMEYLEGQPLQVILSQVPRIESRVGEYPAIRDSGEAWNLAEWDAIPPGLTFEMHLTILCELLAALHHVHELRDENGQFLGAVHRDVSPQNVFVTYDGQIKLVDFGIATALGHGEMREGLVRGRLAYMAPEQVRGESMDRRADVFSVGIFLWEAVACQRMWRDPGNEAQWALQVARGQVPELPAQLGLTCTLEQELELREIVQRALALDPNDRFASAKAFRIALTNWLANRATPVPTRTCLGEIIALAFATQRSERQNLVEAQVRNMRTRTDEREALAAKSFGSGSFEIRDSWRPRDEDMTPTNLEAYRASRSGSLPMAPKRDREDQIPPRRRHHLAIGVAATTLLASGLTWTQFANDHAATRSDTAPLKMPDEEPLRAASLAPAGDPCLATKKPLIEISGDIESDATLSCANDYLLKFRTVVRSGATLTIAAGTRLLGDHETRGLLLVSPGGKLIAKGQPERPIVFTSSREPAQRMPGDWGGVIVLGSAPTNLQDAQGNAAVAQVEGLVEDGTFGGSEPEDESGILTYVRIEYAGSELGPNNEINGLTLAGVGSKTTLHHVLVRDSLDDCFEFFGGTVNADHLVCLRPGDDGFDFDLGYTGRLSHLVYLDPRLRSTNGNAIEADNDANGSRHLPQTAPKIMHSTFCGAYNPKAQDSFGLLARKGARVEIESSIFSGFYATFDLRDHASFATFHECRLIASQGFLFAAPENPHARQGPFMNDDHGIDESAMIRDDPSNLVAQAGAWKCLDLASMRKAPKTIKDGLAIHVAANAAGAFANVDDPWASGTWIGE